jgi:transcriptional regulator with XRE-family HTH domain
VSKRGREEILGDFIRTQREILHLSLRQLANLAQISNPYLSQIERGLYRPSADVLKALARALGISPETLFAQAGLLDEEPQAEGASVEEAIRLDRALSPEQKEALLSVYRGFVGAQRPVS